MILQFLETKMMNGKIQKQENILYQFDRNEETRSTPCFQKQTFSNNDFCDEKKHLIHASSLQNLEKKTSLHEKVQESKHQNYNMKKTVVKVSTICLNQLGKQTLNKEHKIHKSKEIQIFPTKLQTNIRSNKQICQKLTFLIAKYGESTHVPQYFLEIFQYMLSRQDVYLKSWQKMVETREYKIENNINLNISYKIQNIDDLLESLEGDIHTWNESSHEKISNEEEIQNSQQPSKQFSENNELNHSKRELNSNKDVIYFKSYENIQEPILNTPSSQKIVNFNSSFFLENSLSNKSSINFGQSSFSTSNISQISYDSSSQSSSLKHLQIQQSQKQLKKFHKNPLQANNTLRSPSNSALRSPSNERCSERRQQNIFFKHFYCPENKAAMMNNFRSHEDEYAFLIRFMLQICNYWNFTESTITSSCCVFHSMLILNPAIILELEEEDIENAGKEIAVASIFIASKYHEMYPPKMENLLHSSTLDSTDIQYLIALEAKFFQDIGFPYNLLSFQNQEKYLQIFGTILGWTPTAKATTKASESVKDRRMCICNFILENGLTQWQLCHERPSQKAATIVTMFDRYWLHRKAQQNPCLELIWKITDLNKQTYQELEYLYMKSITYNQQNNFNLIADKYFITCGFPNHHYSFK